MTAIDAGGAGSRVEAQQRADRIAAFRVELAELERVGVLALPAEERARVAAHQDGLLRTLAERFDVDVSEGEKQLSLGMRVASFLGALAFAASAVLFFRRFWGLLATPAQVAILVGAPLAGCLGTHFAARREKTGYFAALLALVTFACFVLDLSMLGVIFSITPSENAFLVWGALAVILAYAYGLRLLLAAGIVALTAWLSAKTGTWGGGYWLSFGERPENFLPAGLLLFALPFLVPHRRHADFAPIYRIFGLLTLLLPVLVLANWGEGSYLTSLTKKTIESSYQVVGFAASAAVIAFGIRRRFKDAVNVGSTFFVIFLWTKLYDWWWDWMPKYLFFLIIGTTAAGALWGLKRLRSLTAAQVTEGRP
ncbi:MAG TPA: DUF2157 domain-containing protein [Thermoanaerobaculia bacterium]|nr:DUF2157 domain-containing protein [Thermoanaerobaculia bacterium]